jgi:hypothetical protein
MNAPLIDGSNILMADPTTDRLRLHGVFFLHILQVGVTPHTRDFSVDRFTELR